MERARIPAGLQVLVVCVDDVVISSLTCCLRHADTNEKESQNLLELTQRVDGILVIFFAEDKDDMPVCIVKMTVYEGCVQLSVA